MPKIAIIGAGLSGLSTAHLLKQHTNIVDITLFEKARGVSGRMSTRRAEPYYFDHGAQYFTARTPAFQAFIQPLINDGIIQRWPARYVKFDADQIIERQHWQNDEPRYVGTPGMNSIAKHLARDLTIAINTRITALQRNSRHNTWQLTDEAGSVHEGFDWVISTIPSPQATELLPRAFKYHADISATQMQACFSLMLGFTTPLPLDFDAAHVLNSDLSWIAVNSAKPGRTEHYTLMVHSSADYAEAHIDDDRDLVMQHLCAEAQRVIGHDVSHANYKTVHGWRYANNVKRHPQPVFLDQTLQLAVCGDWCQGGRVEGAFTSAYQLTHALKEVLA